MDSFCGSIKLGSNDSKMEQSIWTGERHFISEALSTIVNNECCKEAVSAPIVRTGDPNILVAFVGNPPGSYSTWHKKMPAAFISDHSRRRYLLNDPHPSPLTKEAQAVVHINRISFYDKGANLAGDTSFGKATMHMDAWLERNKICQRDARK